jgi:serine/threonine protein phosphatase PrpC
MPTNSAQPDAVVTPTRCPSWDFQPLPPWRVGHASLIGSRTSNADSYSFGSHADGRAAFAVADGIGSRPGSVEAAETAAGTAVSDAVANGNPTQALLEASQHLELEQPGGSFGDTVMVLAVMSPAAAVDTVTWDIAWVGDCRAYLLDADGLRQLTHDHTEGQRLRDAGVDESIAARFDHIVLTTVRHATDDPAEIGTASVTSNGRLLLVSDGVGKPLPDDLIEAALTEFPDPTECARALVELGVLDDHADNATALVVDTIFAS